MNYNIIKEYVSFLQKSYLELFKIIFKDKAKKDVYLAFIDRYLTVRYYNETNYSSDKDFMKRINKELIDVLTTFENDEENDIDTLKNIVALFGYIVYFDDIDYTIEEMELINSLVNDDIVKIKDKTELKKQIKDWYLTLKKKKDAFNSTIISKDFNLIEKRLYRRLFTVNLESNVKVSNLYSQFAIDKAYNSGIINEDKAFVTYILTSWQILNNAINLDFAKHFMVPFPSTLFGKEKKRARLLSVLDNTLSKKCICISVTYSDYIKNKKVVNDYINQGYFFAVELDYKYTGNATELVIFPYIIVERDSEEYEMLEREKDHLKSKIIKI